MNQVQIVATIGPNTSNDEVITAMIFAGMSIARLNFSWGTHDDHKNFITIIRSIALRENVRIPIIQDLSGPRIQSGSNHHADLEASVITEKDRRDAKAMADKDLEYVAMSFVKDCNDIHELREILDSYGSKSKIIAKIERQKALDNLDDIIQAADGIMIARGDLGDAIPIEQLPFVEKDILKRCNLAKKPSIVATEMLSSMIDDPLPSRADITDMANAVIDGASATMLSNETAVGTNPVEAVAMMRKVVDEAYKRTAGDVLFF